MDAENYDGAADDVPGTDRRELKLKGKTEPVETFAVRIY